MQIPEYDETKSSLFSGYLTDGEQRYLNGTVLIQVGMEKD